MTIIILPTNVDYLIDDVRITLGDTSNTPKFSDSFYRSAIIGSVKQLGKRWGYRYMVYYTALDMNPQPPVTSGFRAIYSPVGQIEVPDTFDENYVFRNPQYPFRDQTPAQQQTRPITQDDERPIVAGAALGLLRSWRFSDADLLERWSDGEFSYSNVSRSDVYKQLEMGLKEELDAWFKGAPMKPIRMSFDFRYIPNLEIP